MFSKTFIFTKIDVLLSRFRIWEMQKTWDEYTFDNGAYSTPLPMQLSGGEATKSNVFPLSAIQI